MLRRRFYILFVARDEDGQLRKIPVPLKYAYAFLAASIVGAFTIVGLAGSYTRMLLKTESYNQVRAERETLRQNYQRMAEIAHTRSIQVASLGALANEVTELYGLRQNRLEAAKSRGRQALRRRRLRHATLLKSDDLSEQQVSNTIDTFYELRADAMSGQFREPWRAG